MVLELTRLRILNLAQPPLSVSQLFGRFSVGGALSALSSAAPVHTSQRDVHWHDANITLCTTRRMLTENRIELEVWGTTVSSCRQSRYTMLGRARVQCPRTLLEGEFHSGPAIARTIVEMPGRAVFPPVVAMSVALHPWNPDISRGVTRSQVPELVLDVFDYNNGGPGTFLGRASLRGAQLAAMTTACTHGTYLCGRESRPVDLSLRPRSSHEAMRSELVVRGVVTISLIVAGDLNASTKKAINLKAIECQETDTVQDLREAFSFAMEVVDCIISDAWDILYRGRHMIVNIVGANVIDMHEKFKDKAEEEEHTLQDLRGACLSNLSGRNESEKFLRSAYLVATWNGKEVYHTKICLGSSAGSWNLCIPLQPLCESDGAGDNALIIEIFHDDGLCAHAPHDENRRIIGKLTLSLMQLLQLRRVTAAKLRSMGLSIRTIRSPYPNASSHLRLLHPHKSTNTQTFMRLRHAKRENARGCDGDPPRRILLTMSDVAVSGVPDSAVKILRQKMRLYVRVHCNNMEARSKPVGGGGTTATWIFERIQLSLDEAKLREGSLLFQIWMKGVSLTDKLLGEVCVSLEHVDIPEESAVPLTREICRPGHGQQGKLSCSISYSRLNEGCSANWNFIGRCEAIEQGERDMGAVYMSAFINHEAEEADAAVREAKADAQRKQVSEAIPERTSKKEDTLERQTVKAELQQMSTEDFASSSSYDAHNCSEMSGAVSMLQPYTASSFHAEPRACFGVDEHTGLPWTRDERGLRHFFLGFPSVSKSSGLNAQS